MNRSDLCRSPANLTAGPKPPSGAFKAVTAFPSPAPLISRHGIFWQMHTAFILQMNNPPRSPSILPAVNRNTDRSSAKKHAFFRTRSCSAGMLQRSPPQNTAPGFGSEVPSPPNIRCPKEASKRVQTLIPETDLNRIPPAVLPQRQPAVMDSQPRSGFLPALSRRVRRAVQRSIPKAFNARAKLRRFAPTASRVARKVRANAFSHEVQPHAENAAPSPAMQRNRRSAARMRFSQSFLRTPRKASSAPPETIRHCPKRSDALRESGGAALTA